MKYRGNQKQFELNAAIASILENIETETQQSWASNDRIRSLALEARQLLRKRQKLIKITDKSKDGWQVVAKYESDELVSGSEDEKHLKKARETASLNAAKKTEQTLNARKRLGADNQIFRGKTFKDLVLLSELS